MNLLGKNKLKVDRVDGRLVNIFQVEIGQQEL